MRSAPRAAKRKGGRAGTPGPLCALSAVLLAAVAGCGGGGSRYPAYLPKRTLDTSVDRALTGTPARPGLTVEGLAVDVKTRTFAVSITVSGPVVPGEGLPNQPPSTTCTWTVTMSSATADVPVSLKDFHAVNQYGAVTVPTLVPGEHAPPSILRRGRVISFQLRAYQLVGQGRMQWAPDRRHAVAIWDYEVEND
ncbi:MAG TPA: hypothetical protein VKS25_16470 [Solirubrobacteraceae bacterium]|nr:hypothetical protein [Solirubrobacteraceae bacterium]